MDLFVILKCLHMQLAAQHMYDTTYTLLTKNLRNCRLGVKATSGYASMVMTKF
jgi:hypothetical protein